MDDALYRELYQYETLEAAYQAASSFLSDPPEDEESWLINLQNHLVWKSYRVGQDEDLDVVVLEAIGAMLKKHGIEARELTGEVRRLLDELTLA